MAENIIRQDVVQISFDVDTKGLKALDGDIGKIAKQLNANVGKDPFNGVTKSTEKASREATNFAKKLKTAAQTKLDNVKSGLSKISQTMSNVMSVAGNFVVKLKDIGKVGFDKLKNGLKGIADKLGDIAKKSAGSAFNGLKKLASISFKALAVGITGAATAIGAIVTKSVQAYADTEQLIGGVETLFGAGGAKSLDEYAQNVGKTASEVSGEYEKLMAAQEKVLENADNAYRTAGMSANQYMDSVTSFSASLISSLGGDTQKAAEYADMAMVDMSDNANKMGSNIDMIVQTYQSLSRGNFAMLDNLKLGKLHHCSV